MSRAKTHSVLFAVIGRQREIVVFETGIFAEGTLKGVKRGQGDQAQSKAPKILPRPHA